MGDFLPILLVVLHGISRDGEINPTVRATRRYAGRDSDRDRRQCVETAHVPSLR
jgi:hypothetical protein